jgi:hypothetical protein
VARAPATHGRTLANVAGDLPHARLPERDPWGLRAVAAASRGDGFAFSFGPLAAAGSPMVLAHAGAEALPPRIDAWVTPPAYTASPPVFLTSESNRAAPRFTVPGGQRRHVRVTGGSG